jgi:hypothetical protein
MNLSWYPAFIAAAKEEGRNLDTLLLPLQMSFFESSESL